MADDPIVVDNPRVRVDLLIGGKIGEGGIVTRPCGPLTHLMVFDSKARSQFLFDPLNSSFPLDFTLSAQGGATEHLIFTASEQVVEIQVGKNPNDPTGSGLAQESPRDFRRFKLGAPEDRNITVITYYPANQTTPTTVPLNPDGRHIITIIPNGNQQALRALAEAISEAL